MSQFREMIAEDIKHPGDDPVLQSCVEEEKPIACASGTVGARFYLAIATVLLLPLVQSMDMMCKVVALPHIADHFDAFDRYAWFNNVYVLDMFAFNLAFSQWLRVVPSKYVALLAIGVYQFGFALSGAATSVNAMLFGRAVSGIGAAGLISTSIIIFTELCDMKTRINMFNLMVLMFCIGGYIGSLLGGVLTQKLIWRWCFFIHLPIGAALIGMVIAFVPLNRPYGQNKAQADSWTGAIKRICRCDWLGVVLCMAWGLALMTAVETGGTSLPWSHPLQVLLLILVAVLPILFVLWESWLNEGAMLLVALFRNRSMISASIAACANYACVMIVINFTSIAYQALYNVPTERSGQLISLFIIGNVAGFLIATVVLQRCRWAQGLLLAGAICHTASSMGMSMCLHFSGPVGVLIGASLVSGVGMGISMQVPMAIVQDEFKSESTLVASASGCALFANNLGRILGPLIGGSILEHRLQHDTPKYAPALSAQVLQQVHHRYSTIRASVPATLLPGVLQAYRQSLNAVFWAALAFAMLALAASVLGKWQRLSP